MELLTSVCNNGEILQIPYKLAQKIISIYIVTLLIDKKVDNLKLHIM
jgi:hypothetical protein